MKVLSFWETLNSSVKMFLDTLFNSDTRMAPSLVLPHDAEEAICPFPCGRGKVRMGVRAMLLTGFVRRA